MFDNVGSRLKGIAVFVVIFNSICFIIAGIWLLATTGEIWVPLVTVSLGIAENYLVGLAMFCWGETHDEVIETKENAKACMEELKEIKNILNKKCDNRENDDEVTEGNTVVEQENETATGVVSLSGEKSDKNIPVRVIRKTDGSIICPKCGNGQRGDRYRCFSCAQVFINGQNVPFWCGNCGQAGPYENECPACGNTAKIMNIEY